MFRLMATDLDGTLLRSGNRPYVVSPTTVDVVARAQAAGALVVPVTARGPWSVRDVAADFGIRGPAICNSGATIYDLVGETIIEHLLLEPDAAFRIVSHLRGVLPGVAFACSWETGYAREEAYVPGIPPPEDSPVGAIEGFLGSGVHKLLVKHADLGAEDLFARVSPHIDDGLLCGTTGGTFVEILAPGATKAAALERLCASLGVARDEVVAFGDWPNDIPMLRWAGLGVAPANAHAEVLAAADEVAPSNDEDGVAVFIARLLGDGLIGPVSIRGRNGPLRDHVPAAAAEPQDP